MGSLNGNHPELFQLDSLGNRLYSLGFSNPAANQYFYLMDFGAPAWQGLLVEAVRTDFANQPWGRRRRPRRQCVTFPSGAGYSPTPKYPTDRRLVRCHEFVLQRDLRRTAWLWPETLVATEA